jgi:hypothetical protein
MTVHVSDNSVSNIMLEQSPLIVLILTSTTFRQLAIIPVNVTGCNCTEGLVVNYRETY